MHFVGTFILLYILEVIAKIHIIIKCTQILQFFKFYM
jgi:hypothetical protein